MSKHTCGAAVFVKTIGNTPLKTRLAKGVGEAHAHDFYRLSCAAVQSVLEQSPGVKGYWSVAEGEVAFEHWAGLEAMGQGQGSLGERLDYVYQALLKNHRFAALLGADAPQICPEVFANALELARGGNFVMGPAEDGGFYLLLGSKPIPSDVWTRVPYSHPDTGQLLCAELQSIADVEMLEPLADVDEQEDLARLGAELRVLQEPLPSQVRLLQWLDDLSL
ncbi:TIGR04282 family arsenosugar biosynthesis glycosyltransferase [Pseudobacteriovorax antillogorgiicola]|uniref:Glycosyltransferase n=1 Tax=Pseudobacteriovorax antillogorgiicola TaxID=1513793 RepID=A0A1Y6CY41_9BACT|nr:DUF2064 domain-containing protein [Pseudobacteriovorax antillogorgiicola]TCS42238.1 hypothetical protein EDD56_1429 [Pseudobacteriovorax antillogorgiicola]SMF82552.1 hypothetical protein SAMN06296036_1429 [Pseudobacteriovorax antillogorgiicola]